MGEDGDELERWAAEARAREAADSRTQERWLRRQAAESSTMAGVLRDLGDQQLPVVVATTAGRSHRTESVAVGDDFVALRMDTGHTVMVPMAAVVEVRAPATGKGRRAVAGDAGEAEDRRGLGASLAGVLAQAAGQRPRLSVRTPTSTVVGDLSAVGADVLMLLVEGDPPVPAYLRLASVSEISLFASG